MEIGFIGLGDVGSRFSSGISKEGASVIGYDLKIGQERFREKEMRCLEHGVKLVKTIKELVEKSGIILAATSCDEAIKTAETAVPYLHAGQYYVDVNSAVPKIKKAIQNVVEQTGAMFVDGGIMDSPLNGWHKIPLVMSGAHAEDVIQTLNEFGMMIRNVGPDVGQASSLKILRSIFTKGLEALLVESLSAAHEHGVMEEVFQSILDMFAGEPMDTLLGRMVSTNTVHSWRRALEVGAVSEMLKEELIDNTMSQAAYEKLMWCNNSDAKAYFQGAAPESYAEAIAYYAALRNS